MKRLRKRPGHKFKNFKADHNLRQQTLHYAIFSKKMALTPDNDVPLPENIQAKDKIYPPVISLVSPYNSGDCTRRSRHEIDDVDARRKLDQFLCLAKSNT